VCTCPLVCAERHADKAVGSGIAVGASTIDEERVEEIERLREELDKAHIELVTSKEEISQLRIRVAALEESL